MLKKWYDNEVDEELKGFYKTVLTMYETSKEKALEYAKGDKIMEKYIEESKKMQNRDNGLLRSYDHELAYIKAGQDEGREKTRIENARALIKKGADRDFIIDALELTATEIKALNEEK